MSGGQIFKNVDVMVQESGVVYGIEVMDEMKEVVQAGAGKSGDIVTFAPSNLTTEVKSAGGEGRQAVVCNGLCRGVGGAATLCWYHLLLCHLLCIPHWKICCYQPLFLSRD